MSEEWGPWVEHDGMGGPKTPIQSGETVRIVGENWDGTPHDAVGVWETWHGELPQWRWKAYGEGFGQVHRYRIRKPRGLTILERIAADPQPVKESA